jgi:hypothetical protein
MIPATGSRGILQESTGNSRNVEAVFPPEIYWIFSSEFRSISRALQQEPVGNHRKKSKNFPVGILLPRSGDFRYFPAGTAPYFSTWVMVYHYQNLKELFDLSRLTREPFQLINRF